MTDKQFRCILIACKLFAEYTGEYKTAKYIADMLQESKPKPQKPDRKQNPDRQKPDK